jgi:hypothetical protein
MKTIAGTSESKNGFKYHIDYKFRPTEDSKSLKAWEEDNEEYTSWNFIVEETDQVSC